MVVDRSAVAEQAPRPVLSAKVQPPVDRRRVSRPRLLALCAGAPRKVTVIHAPAGWGKSTLLAEWHTAEAESRRFAWLTLDRGDNDPVRFWTYLIEALRTQHPDAGTTSLPALEAHGSPSSTTSSRRSATSWPRRRTGSYCWATS